MQIKLRFNMIILYITMIANFPLYGQKIDKIQLNSDYQFCSTKSNNDIQLNQPVDFIVTENHDLIVCDKKDNCIVIFNSKGELIEKFGRFGQGPGEFNRPEKIGFIGDNLIVLDCGNLRIQVVNPKGEYVRAHPIPAICSIMLDYNRISFLSNGSYLYNPAGYQSTNLIISNSIDGKILNKYGKIKGEAKDYLDSGKKLIKRGRIPDLYKNSVFPVQKMDGKIYCIHTGAFLNL